MESDQTAAYAKCSKCGRKTPPCELKAYDGKCEDCAVGGDLPLCGSSYGVSTDVFRSRRGRNSAGQRAKNFYIRG